MEIISESTPKANKDHHCSFCGLKIKKGNRYSRQVNKGDCGDVFTWISHFHCNELANKLNMYEDYYLTGEGLTGESFCEVVEEYLCSTLQVSVSDWKTCMKTVMDSLEIKEDEPEIKSSLNERKGGRSPK